MTKLTWLAIIKSKSQKYRWNIRLCPDFQTTTS